MEVNSLPLAMWLAVKRSSNRWWRTAGINEEPPVRKTWSIAPAPMSRVHQRASRIPPNQPEAYVPIG